MEPAIGLSNTEIEGSIIGSILLNPDCIGRVREELTLNDFTLKKHQIIYETLLTIADRGDPIKISVLISYLSNNGGLGRVGGKDYLSDLVESTGTSAAIEYFVKEIKEISARRNLFFLLQKCQESIKKDEPLTEIFAYLEEELEKLKEKDKSRGQEYVDASDLLTIKFDKTTSVIGNGILPAGGALILAGESGVGKSTLRTEIAIHLTMGWNLYGLPIERAKKVLIIQFENPESTEQYRLSRMMKGFRIESLARKLTFSNQKIRFDLSLKRDRGKALEFVKGSEAEVIIWDPLSSIHSVNENDNIQIRSILDTLTEINRKANTSCILIHHFGKPQENLRTEHRTRGASAIRDWADTLIAVTRKRHESKILRYLTFIKIRSGPENKPILLQKDKEYFTHAVVEEDIMGSPDVVAEVLERIGGRVKKQSDLSTAVAEHVRCSQRSAVTFIKNAVDKTIKEYGDKGPGKRKEYCLFDR